MAFNESFKNILLLVAVNEMVKYLGYLKVRKLFTKNRASSHGIREDFKGLLGNSMPFKLVALVLYPSF